MKNNNISNDNGNRLFTVIGADTYLGAHMLKHLRQKFRFVFGFSQDESFNMNSQTVAIDDVEKIYDDVPTVDSDWLVICLDPDIGFAEYTAKIKKMCDDMAKREFCGDICFLSSASVCFSKCDALSEETPVYPRTEHDLSLVTAENMLTVLSCNPQGYAVPHIMRIGVPYGDEIGMNNLSGFANRMIMNAERKSALKIPMGGEAKRSLGHISDICEAAIELMCADSCPALVNIPGEVRSIIDVGSAISQKYHVDFKIKGLSSCDDQEYFAGDQHLSAELFNQTIKFTPKHTFNQWLNENLPEKSCLAVNANVSY